MDDVDLLTEPLLPSPDVVSRRVAGEYLLVPVRSGTRHAGLRFCTFVRVISPSGLKF